MLATAQPRGGGVAAARPSQRSLLRAIGKAENVDPEWLLAPGDFTRAEKVADGATAVVYRGRCRGVDVAVKEIAAADHGHALRELRILQRVQHPNLVRLVGVAQDLRAGTIQLVMAFCAGGTAFELLHESQLQLAWRQKGKMALDVARAMQYLHQFEPPIIHRDLKSLNLLLEERILEEWQEPVVMVADFGLSRMQVDGTWPAMTTTAGTSHWMAPEVFAGEEYDHKVDVYSYGMVLYEVVCQEIPFKGEAPSGLGLRVAQGLRPDLALVPGGCPETLRVLMVESWSPDAALRPDFFEVCGALLSVLAPWRGPEEEGDREGSPASEAREHFQEAGELVPVLYG